MSNTKLSPGIVSARLSEEDYSNNFSDAYPGFNNYEAKVEADRCYFCYDAPCISACPTEINIPLFIRQISTEMEEEAAKTIFDQNILGGMCARVCPTETLCEDIKCHHVFSPPNHPFTHIWFTNDLSQFDGSLVGRYTCPSS